MKKTLNIIIILMITTLIAGCTSLRPRKGNTQNIDLYMSEEEQADWSTNGDTIYYKLQPIAYIQSSELEYYDGKITQEISISTINPYSDEEINIIRYIHSRKPNAKIEVNTDGPKPEE